MRFISFKTSSKASPYHTKNQFIIHLHELERSICIKISFNFAFGLNFEFNINVAIQITVNPISVMLME